jgi:D-lactate dehydrogenase
MLDGEYGIFVKQISKHIPKTQIFTDKLTTLVYGTDASCYRLIPKVVVKAQNEEQVRVILKHATALKLPITFRAQGTSLCGQAITDSILVITQEGWKNYQVLDSGNQIKLDVGIIGNTANSYLKPYYKKIGPDPATINVALIGGIVANNSSGMCCGVAQNTYHTIKDMRVMLHDGTILDTAEPNSVAAFRKSHSYLLQNLKDLANEVSADKDLSELIKKKYKIKNTTGYSINALVDFDDEIEILKHLMVGSEGTLGFISNVTYYTVDDNPYKASALVFFKTTQEACNNIIKLQELGKIVDSAEFMDRTSLKTMENEDGVPQSIKSLDEKACAVLIQTTGYKKEELYSNITKIEALIDKDSIIGACIFKDNPKDYDKYWKIRKGLFTKVGAIRRKNTTVIIEDITFPIKDLSLGITKLRDLLNFYGYQDSIIFGHSLAGNLHFVLTIDFYNKKEVEIYDAFMNAMVVLVADEFKGSIKAEHGTGRNIAPFVEKEWGKKAYSLMVKIKEIFDPHGILNKDVIITKDPQLHLKNLKEINESHEIIDKCIECGFCEPTCPSKDITFTPRQRIVAYRYLHNTKDKALHKEISKQMKDFKYKSMDTCAACSLCSNVCPVYINTGSLSKYLRYKSHGVFNKFLSNIAARNYALVIFFLRMGLMLGNILSNILGKNIMNKMSVIANKLTLRTTPVWRRNMPKPANVKTLNALEKQDNYHEKSFVYFASCMNKVFGTNQHPFAKDKSIHKVMASLAKKAGYNMILVNDNSLCCGMPFNSKGYNDAADYKSKELEQKLLLASDNGKYPIVTDLSSCTLQMLNSFKEKSLNIQDIGSFCLKYFVPEMKVDKIITPITIHINCSAQKLKENDSLIEIAKTCAEKVVIPINVSCCGFAGDKGMFLPELNYSALKYLKEEVKDCELGFSTNCSCEIGLSELSGIPYTSILYLLDEASSGLAPSEVGYLAKR